MEEVEQSIADQGARRRRVRVSAAVSHGRVCIAPLLKGFVRRHPHIVVDINPTDEKVDVAQGQADIAIRSGPKSDSLLVAKRLGDNGRTIVAAPVYLAEPVWPFRRDGVTTTLAVRGSIEIDSGETLLQLALDGARIARLGNFGIGRALAEGRLVPLLEPFNPGDREVFNAVFVGGSSRPARIRLFVDHLADHYGDRIVERPD